MLLVRLLYEPLVAILGSMVLLDNTSVILRQRGCECYSLQQSHTIFRCGLGCSCQYLVEVGLEESETVCMGRTQEDDGDDIGKAFRSVGHESDGHFTPVITFI